MKQYFNLNKVKNMSRNNVSFSFLTIGKTQESTEASEGFKRYVGLASSYVLGVNPNKADLDKMMGFESQNEPEYTKDTDNGKEAHIHFIVKTDPETNNGIEIVNRAMFTLRNAPAYNRDQTKVQVIDGFGNYTWASVEDAKAGKVLTSADGKPLKIDTKYRMACVGECDLVAFLKAYLCVADAFNYINGSWVKKDNPDEYTFSLEHVKDYFNGDFSELKEAIALQPNNKVKLLYGVRTTEDNRQYQAVCTKGELILRNSSGSNAVAKLEKDLVNAKQNGAYASTDFRVQELTEWSVEPTNLETPEASDSGSSSQMPWD